MTALAVIEVPAALPLDAHMAEARREKSLALAEAIGDHHGVRVERSVVHARRAARRSSPRPRSMTPSSSSYAGRLDRTARTC